MPPGKFPEQPGVAAWPPVLVSARRTPKQPPRTLRASARRGKAPKPMASVGIPNHHTCRLTLIVVTHAVIELLEDVHRAPGSDSLPGAHELFG